MPKPDAPVPERTTTVRAALHEALLGSALSARELSMRVGAPEKDVIEHLEHLQQSLRKKGERLVVKPAECLGCSHVFRDRTRLAGPGRCPRCQGEHIASPTFRIEPAPTPGPAPRRPRRARDDEDGDED
jgi:predicted Zn-ribbon and HTH transcriptional regulator